MLLGMLLHRDSIQQCIEDCFEAEKVNYLEKKEGYTVYNAAGIASFHASPPKISFQREGKDQGLPLFSFSQITTAPQMNSFKTSLRKTAVDEKYRAPLTTGIIRE